MDIREQIDAKLIAYKLQQGREPNHIMLSPIRWFELAHNLGITDTRNILLEWRNIPVCQIQGSNWPASGDGIQVGYVSFFQQTLKAEMDNLINDMKHKLNSQMFQDGEKCLT